MKYLILLLFLISCHEEINPEWTIVEPGKALIAPLCDSMGCVIRTVDYTFSNVELVMIYFRDWDNCGGCWTPADTLYSNGEWITPAYLGMAQYLGVPDSVVCSGLTTQGILMSFSGSIQWDGLYTSGDHAFRVDEADHPYYQLGFWKTCD